MRGKPDEISLLISNSNKNTKSKRRVKKEKVAICMPKGWNLKKCVERSELKGSSSTGRMRYLVLGGMFNLRIRERFLTATPRELWNIFPLNINKTTKKFPTLSEKFLKEAKLYVVEIVGNWEWSFLCSDEVKLFARTFCLLAFYW